MAIKTKKDRIPKGVRDEFDDVDYWDRLKKSKETFTLKDGTVLSAYQYMKKFMQESYGNGFDRNSPDSNILQTVEQKKWAYRNNNNLKRDALLVSKKSNRLTTNEYLINKPRRMYDRKEEWEVVLKSEGPEFAMETLLKDTCVELGIRPSVKTKKTLLNLFYKLVKLTRIIKKEQRKN